MSERTLFIASSICCLGPAHAHLLDRATDSPPVECKSDRLSDQIAQDFPRSRKRVGT